MLPCILFFAFLLLILVFYLSFVSVITVCLSVFLHNLSCLGIPVLPGLRWLSFPKLGKFIAVIPQTRSLFSPSETPLICMLLCLVSQMPFRCFHSPFFILLHGWHFSHSICQVTSLFFCSLILLFIPSSLFFLSVIICSLALCLC